MSVRRVGTRRVQAAALPVDAASEAVPRRSATRRTPGVGGTDIIPPTPVTRSGTRRVGISAVVENASTSSAVPPRRATTRRAPGAKSIGQGMEEVYPNTARNTTDMDIIFVPGLGAHPKDTWRSRTTDFNWVSDKEGLARDFPRARILVYMYESTWLRNNKVKQYMDNLATTLLSALQSSRENFPTTRPRPIVFVGHCMGGLIVAKAISYAADSRRELFPKLFESIAGCFFFGTPFGGAPAAEFAATVAHWGENIDLTVTSKLLELMKPDNESLYELRNDFVRCVGKLSQRIKLFAFFEEQETDFGKMVGLPRLASLVKLFRPKSLKGLLVDRDSATLSGVMDSMGMASNHGDMVKFESFKDPRYQAVRDPLKSIIHSAHLVVKNRLNSTRNIDREMVKNLMEMLEGAQVAKKRRTISQSGVVPSEWIPREEEYVNWLAKPTDTSSDEQWLGVRGGDCLWIYGSEGRGKTSAVLAALDDIDEMILNLEKKGSGEAPIILAYFFCDTTSDYCTAEDLLKSLVRQLIDRQEMLATYAKQFVKKKSKDDPKTQTSMTVENLWQTLQDMLGDEDLGSRVYFVIHNLHALPDHTDSTKKLMGLFQGTLKYTNNQDFTRRVPIRWLLTSRQSHIIKDALLIPGTRTLDLEDDRYSNHVSLANRKHAQHKIRELTEKKRYTKALAYFASSLIGRKAQNTQWIDVACMRLEELQTNNDLQVRSFLEGMPQDLKTLLDYAWKQIFTRDAVYADGIREVLRVMLLTFEDPTLDALKVLAGFDGYLTDGEYEDGPDEYVDLAALVDQCKPFLELKGKGNKENRTVGFMSLVVKKHLLENAEDLLALTAEKVRWQHGVIAHRAFSHIMERCRTVALSDTQSRVEGESVEYVYLEEEWVGQNSEYPADGSEYYSDAGSENAFGSAHGGFSNDNADPEAGAYGELEEPLQLGTPHAYAVKHWLHHASKATAEIAQELSLEEEFWEPESPIRRQWLQEYTRLTNEFLRDFVKFDHGSMSALHVASSIGYRQLVCALIKNGYASEITAKNATLYTPLHFAAWFGRSHIVEVLLDNKAPVDDGIDAKDLTPLHMAACQGHVEVMERLLKSKADANAMCNEFGPVINGAIMSGNRRAVELLVDAKAELSLESDEFESPLALATLFPDKSMFDHLVKSCSDKLPNKEYEKALIRAAEEGRVDIFEQLISANTIQYTRQCYEEALRVAEKESSWDIIRVLLQKHSGLDCIELFTKAATGTASQDQILTDIWEHTQHNIPLEVLNKCLYRAADLEKESTVELLLSFKADPNAMGQEFGNALTASAFDGTINIVKTLAAAGADINSPNGWPLHAAAAGGHLDVVAELLVRGAEVNRVMTKGQRKTITMHGGTALQAACEASKREVVDLLLKHGADPNLGPPSGNTCPLIVASRKGEAEIFESLVKANASVDVFGGSDKTTPLINAAVSLPKRSLELLLEHGANINLTDKTVRDTALIVASRKGDAELVSCLLEHGADILHSNRRGENALQAAALASRVECLRVLIQHMSGIMGRLTMAIEAGDKEVARVVRGLGRAPKEDNAVGDGNQFKAISTINEEITEQRATVAKVIMPENDDSSKIVASMEQPVTETKIIMPQNDDSSKMVANMEQDVDRYNFDTLGDVDDMGIPFALPSLGFPLSFSAASAPPPILPPSLPSIEANGTAADLISHPPQDIRAWTPDSAPFGIYIDEGSRAASSAMIRRKPTANGRKSTVSFSDQMSPAAPTPPTSSLGHRSSMDQDIATGPPRLTDSPQPIQSPFVPPPPPPSSPPKQPQQVEQQVPSQQMEPSNRARRDSAMAQPAAYAALVAANFRSQSQPNPQSQPQLLRQSQSSTQLHQQPAHSASSSYSLRSLYSVPSTSLSPMSPPLVSPAPTNSSFVSSVSSNTTIGSRSPTPSQQQQVQQQRDLYHNLQQQRQSKIDAYSSFHERLTENEPRQAQPQPQHQQPQSLTSSWTMQVGAETAEQPITNMNTGSPDPQVESQSKPMAQIQRQMHVQHPPRSQSQPPKVSTPPISYDGEGWGDSPVADDRPVVVDVKQHVRTAVLAVEEDPKSQGWTKTGSI